MFKRLFKKLLAAVPIYDIHAAAKNGHVEIICKLLKTNIDINAVDAFGCTAIELAAENGYKEIVRIFLKAGVDVSSKNKALVAAAENNHGEIVELLLNHGAYVNAVDEYGDTALMWAAENDNITIAKLLVSYGAQGIEDEDYYSNELKEVLEAINVVNKILRKPNLCDITEDTESLLFKNFLTRVGDIENLELVLNDQFLEQLQSSSKEMVVILIRTAVNEFIIRSVVAGVEIKVDGGLTKSSERYIINIIIKHILTNGIPDSYLENPEEYIDYICQVNPVIKKGLKNSWQEKIECSYQNLVMIFYSIYDCLNDSNIIINKLQLSEMAVLLLETIRNPLNCDQEQIFIKWQQANKINEYQKNPVKFLSEIINILRQVIQEDVWMLEILEILRVLGPLLDGTFKIIKTEKQVIYLNNLATNPTILYENCDLLEFERRDLDVNWEYSYNVGGEIMWEMSV